MEKYMFNDEDYDWDNKEVVLQQVAIDGLRIQFVSESLLKDRKVILTAVQNTDYHVVVFQYMHPSLRTSEEIALAAVKKNGATLALLNDDLRDNLKIVKAAIDEEPYAFQYASTRMKHNASFAEYVIDKNPLTMAILSDEMREAREALLETIRKNSKYFRNMTTLNVGDKQLMMIAVGLDDTGKALLYTADALKADEEVVWAAIQRNGRALKYADRRIQANHTFVLKALESDPSNFQYADEMIRDTDPFVYEVCKNYPEAIEFASSRIKKWSTAKNWAAAGRNFVASNASMYEKF